MKISLYSLLKIAISKKELIDELLQTVPLEDILEATQSLWDVPVVNATCGHGGLTVGVNEEGVITNLNWPNPSYHDHVNFYSTGDPRPLYNKGVFTGVIVQEGDKRNVCWLKRPHWRISQRYLSTRGNVISTKYWNEEQEIEIITTDSVHPEYDIFSRKIRVSKNIKDRELSFIFYNNFAPTTFHLPRLPSVTDALMDEEGDFGTIYLEEYDVLLHFMPTEPENAKKRFMKYIEESKGKFEINKLEEVLGEGVYLATGLSTRSREHQVGLDGKDIQELEEKMFVDPYFEVSRRELPGNNWALGQTVGALVSPPIREVSFYITVGENISKALRTLKDAKRIGSENVEKASDDAWNTILERIRIPEFRDERMRDMMYRAIIFLWTSRDRVSGCIVGTTATQSPYRQDWPRDGFFFTLFLEEIGLHEIAEKRSLWLSSLQREDGTWDSFYYADGVEAGFIWKFQLDTNGFAAASLWLPYTYTKNIEYLKMVYPALKKSADFLTAWRDPETGKPKEAYVDDSYEKTQDIQGAVAVYLALEGAISAAEVLGREEDAEGWKERIEELKRVILYNYTEKGPYGEQYPASRGGKYLLWLTDIVPKEDERIQNMLRVIQRRLEQMIERKVDSFLYPQEDILALMHGWNLENEEKRRKIKKYIDWLIYELPKPGLLHYGETILVRNGKYVHGTGYPHLWSSVETALILLTYVRPLKYLKREWKQPSRKA